MPRKIVDEDRIRRKAALDQKRAARRVLAKKEAETSSWLSSQTDESASTITKTTKTITKTGTAITATGVAEITDPCSWLLQLPEVAIQEVFSFLPASDMGRFILTCKSINSYLALARVPFLVHRCCFSRQLNNNSLQLSGCLQPTTNTDESYCHSSTTAITAAAPTAAEQAHTLLSLSYGGGNTERIEPRGYAKANFNDFVSYARFLDEAVSGYAVLSAAKRCRRRSLVLLPKFVQGRFASVSPEHSVCRVGGDGTLCGAGGSGVASWGVGRRGQLGHGQRQDLRLPQRLLGGLGYGIRIVQVSAGGGLVRVAHTLLLTDTGRVLSFGAGQYGALGHGYSKGAKQLPDILRPQYIDALSHVTVTCVAAGELHCAVVSSDGDVYTWGDGFCGQLGHAGKRPQVLPKQVTCGGLEDECVSTISCGNRHTIAVTEDGEVFTWGLGHFGCLGRSFTPFDYDADADVAVFTGTEGFAGNHQNHHDQILHVPFAPTVDSASNSFVTPSATAAAGLEIDVDQAGGRDYDNKDPPTDDDYEEGDVGHRHDDHSDHDHVDYNHETTAPMSITQRNFVSAEMTAHLNLIANLSLDDTSNQCIPRPVEVLKDITIVGCSAGHRHSLFLSKQGGLYSCGAGYAGCLGHGNTLSHMYPMRIAAFDEEGVQIRQMSAGVDLSMAVDTNGTVYSWGKANGGRLGLGLTINEILLPRKVTVRTEDGSNVRAVDVECSYVHGLIVALDGTLHMCGRVGIEGEADGILRREDDEEHAGRPKQIPDFNIWHRIPEPKEKIARERWKKLDKYEIKGRTRMLSASKD